MYKPYFYPHFYQLNILKLLLNIRKVAGGREGVRFVNSFEL